MHRSAPGRGRTGPRLLTAALIPMLAGAALTGCTAAPTSRPVRPAAARPSSPATASAPPADPFTAFPLLVAKNVSTEEARWAVGPHAGIIAPAVEDAFLPGDQIPQNVGTTTLAAGADGALQQTSITFAPAEEQGQDITSDAYGVEQTEAGAPSFVAAAVVHTPSSGVTPESWSVRAALYAPGRGKPGATLDVRLPTDTKTTLLAVGRSGATLVVAYRGGSENQDRVSGVDAESGRVLWTRSEAALESNLGGVVAVLDERDADSSGTGGALLGLDARSGERLWRFTDPQGRPFSSVTDVLDARYAQVRVEGEQPNESRLSVVDLTAGATVFTRFIGGTGPSVAYDPQSERFIATDVARTAAAAVDGRTTLEVLDAKGEVTFDISAAQYRSLGAPSVLAAADGRAWIRLPQGIDLIDETNGEQDPASPAVTKATNVYYPIAGAGGGFTVLSRVPAPDDGEGVLLLAHPSAALTAAKVLEQVG